MARARVAPSPDPAANRILAHLSTRERRDFVRSCEAVPLVFGATLAEPDAPIRYVYLPLTGFVSVMVPSEGGASLEVGLIGNEGLLGATLALGVNSAPLHALVQGAGVALRMSAGGFIERLHSVPRLQVTLLKYSYILLRQFSQMAACTRYHTVSERLARWLLMTQDRARGAEFHLTQQFLGQMLGVRRVGVTHAAGALQKQGLIGYRRGEIIVTDRRGLQRASCACYSRDKRLYQRTLG